jgi:hypothetical protein
MGIHLRICLALGAAALVVARAQAAESDGEVVKVEGSSRPSPRALDGHLFQPSQLLTQPFTTTSFGMTTFFGSGTVQAPRYDILGKQIGTRDYTIGVYGQGLDLSLRLFPDVALRFNVAGLIYSGVDARGILVVGTTAQLDLKAGLTAGRNLGRTARLSFVVDFGPEPQLSVLVGNAVLNAIQNRTFDTGGVFSNVDRLRINPGLSFAWAPIPWLGFIAETRYVWARRITGQVTGETAARSASGVSLGGLVSLDIDPLIRFPLAVQASYRGDLSVGSPGIPEVHQAGLGFFYSRAARLALGLEALWRHGDIRPGVVPTLKADSGTGQIWFRYYW